MSIRHRPLGSGHPYTDDTEQRSPILPVAGERVRIGARTSADVEAVDVEWRLRGDTTGDVLRTAAAPVARSSRGQDVDGGHLASAQAKLARRAGGWEAHLDLPTDATGIEYRLIARSRGAEQRTRQFVTPVARWTRVDADTVRITGSGHHSVTQVSALIADGRVRRVRCSLPLAEGEHVVGFGERFDRLDHRGTTLDSMVFEQYKSQGAQRRTYMPMPFAHVAGGVGWGFHVDTTRRVWFDVGDSTPDLLSIEAETDALLGDTALEIALFDGKPTTVLRAFLDRVGRAEELPSWVFRLWASGNEWNTQAEIERQVALHRDHDIPIGSVVIEAWSDESSFTAFRDAEYTPREDGGPLTLADFTFPTEGAWPDPVAMVDTLHAADVKVLLWQIPLIKMRPHPSGQARHDADAAIRERRLIEEVAPDGGLRPYRNRGWWFPLGLMPDLTDAEAARWWTEKRRYLVEEVGVDGFKTDGGEHAWGSDLRYLDGRDGGEANNTYPVAYAKSYGDLLRSAGKAPVTFSRAGFTGSQAHGLFWAGDENSTWEAFRWSMVAGLSAAASGVVYWGWDIAGFSGPVPDPELYVRAFAASAFVPIMQYHSEFNHHRRPRRDRTPWNMADLTGDTEVIGEIREIVHLRERLVPYLEKQARLTIESSRPLMRPLFFDYDDDRVWSHPLQWMLGDDLLIAPVLAPGAEWDVFLPPGLWRDAWTGEKVSGGTVIATSTPRHRVPVFVRDAGWDELRDVFTASS
ncbi:glycoside hydrolase family 31 protein [Demequina aestuarii]|uniref:glycoside hydrolase family 31 protein n=1 Tax=Demequina aestuarii TaxID=327095 RepID=UPI000784089A|nr:TIM-barrel domain-containing protein [Demequina aestuarii]